jgi:acyl carrier protein
MTDAEILSLLTEIFRKAFGDASLVLAPATTARDIAGWDSAMMVMLVLAVEERFGIRMRSREIDALKSIGDFVTLIAAHRAA